MMTLEKFREMKSLMKTQSTPPSIVKTEEEANEMTLRDQGLTGQRWKVGEKYYRMEQVLT